MGTINHDAIVVTAFRPEAAALALEKARELGLPASDLVYSPLNGYVSFLIAPDGSKEWWPESDLGNKQRDAWKAWMHSRWSTDFVNFVHIRYGEIEAEANDDGSEATIVESQPDASCER